MKLKINIKALVEYQIENKTMQYSGLHEIKNKSNVMALDTFEYDFQLTKVILCATFTIK